MLADYIPDNDTGKRALQCSDTAGKLLVMARHEPKGSLKRHHYEQAAQHLTDRALELLRETEEEEQDG